MEWDHATRTVSLHKDGKILYLRIDQNYMWDGEGNIPIDTAPTIIGDRTMVPLRAPLEYFGATVHWDHEARMATITYIQQLEK